MPKVKIDNLLGSEVLSEDVKARINEAWETKLNEARAEIATNLREEFAVRYDNDKAQLIEAMDAKLNDTIHAELKEFAQDRAKLAEERVAYKKAMKSHAKVFEKFILESLKKEITELRDDRNNQKKNFGKLEEFVLGQLTNELNEFHNDRRSLIEQKVRMVKEGKKVIAEAKAAFVKKAAKKINSVMETTIRGELSTLREDIQQAKENEFGRKLFETFAAEFASSTLSEGTEVAKLSRKISQLSKQLVESKALITEKEKAITEATRKSKRAIDLSERKLIMAEMMAPLTRDQRDVMGALLESVKTDSLRTSYKKYLPNVLKEAKPYTQNDKKANLTESTASTVITGDKIERQDDFGSKKSADIISLKKLAGL
jgi:hypothetical protein